MEGPPAIPRDAEYGLVSQFWRKAMEKDAGKRLTDQNHEQDYVHKEIRDNFFHGSCISFTCSCTSICYLLLMLALIYGHRYIFVLNRIWWLLNGYDLLSRQVNPDFNNRDSQDGIKQDFLTLYVLPGP